MSSQITIAGELLQLCQKEEIVSDQLVALGILTAAEKGGYDIDPEYRQNGAKAALALGCIAAVFAAKGIPLPKSSEDVHKNNNYIAMLKQMAPNWAEKEKKRREAERRTKDAKERNFSHKKPEDSQNQDSCFSSLLQKLFPNKTKPELQAPPNTPTTTTEEAEFAGEGGGGGEEGGGGEGGEGGGGGLRRSQQNEDDSSGSEEEDPAAFRRTKKRIPLEKLVEVAEFQEEFNSAAAASITAQATGTGGGGGGGGADRDHSNRSDTVSGQATGQQEPRRRSYNVPSISRQATGGGGGGGESAHRHSSHRIANKDDHVLLPGQVMREEDANDTFGDARSRNRTKREGRAKKKRDTGAGVFFSDSE